MGINKDAKTIRSQLASSDWTLVLDGIAKIEQHPKRVKLLDVVQREKNPGALNFLFPSYTRVSTSEEGDLILPNWLQEAPFGMFVALWVLSRLVQDGYVSTMTRLQVAGQKLPTLPDNISALTGLEYIDLSNNKITSLPDSICDLPKVKDLNLSHNQGLVLPSGIGKLKD